jgi:GMP reductase
MRIENDVKLDYDDVLIRPKRSNAPSRKDVVLKRTFKMLHSDNVLACIPICASNFDTVGSIEMARALVKQNLLCCLHKFYAPWQLVSFFASDASRNTFYTLGLKEDDFEKLETVSRQISIKKICLDAANGNTQFFVQRVCQLRKKYKDAIIMVGNTCVPEMVQELLLEGADIIKIGIGSGSVCTTRLMTGCGYPQLSAVIECADAAHGLNGFICSDGGCKTPGDIAKAIGGGADIVMLGGMFAGTEECEGEWTEEGLKFHGMSSKEVQELHYDGVPDYATAEGKCIIALNKGPVKGVIQNILGGLRSACTYVGADSLKAFSKCTTFIRVK